VETRRIGLALAGSALLHLLLLGWPLALPKATSATAPALQVRLLSPPPAAPASRAVLALPGAGEPMPPPDTAVTAPPTLAERAAQLAAREPGWLAAMRVSRDPRYYTADEVDPGAVPLQPIVVESPAIPLPEPAWVRLEVRIDEFGVVDAVNVLGGNPPGVLDESVRQPFLAALWRPAQRQGRPVRSSKLIEVCFGPCRPPAPGERVLYVSSGGAVQR
jgi:protein TonB